MAKSKIDEAAEAPGADETIVIKKYANRRLYDTSSSSYVNLDQVADMVRDGRDVMVVEAKGGADVTRQVLTQIIVEGSRDADGPPVEFLQDLVRAGDRAQRDFLQWYLSSASQVYQRVKSGWERAYRLTPAGMLSQRLAGTWDPSIIAKTLRPMFDPAARTQSGGEGQRETDGGGGGPSEEAGSDDPAAELARLRRQLDALQEKIEG